VSVIREDQFSISQTGNPCSNCNHRTAEIEILGYAVRNAPIALCSFCATPARPQAAGGFARVGRGPTWMSGGGMIALS
jgi:hypothetical protein